MIISTWSRPRWTRRWPGLAYRPMPEPPRRRYDYVSDAAEIYRRSFATIRAEADLSALAADAQVVAVRMIHATGEVTLPAEMAFHPRLVSTARDALRAGAPIFTDAQMIASGITRRRLPAENAVHCLLHDERTPGLAYRWGTTRSAAAVSLWGSELEGAVVAIGNAPTALFHLLELIADGGPQAGGDHRDPGRLRRLGRIQGGPGGQPVGPALPGGARSPRRIGALRRGRERPGPGGGDLMAGRLYAVGVGPGDPELLTLKAARIIRAAPVVAYYSGTRGVSIARSIVADLLAPDVIEELLTYPVTVGQTEHREGYPGVIGEFYDASAERLASHLEAGRDVVVLAEGDPLFYSSYMYLHDRLAGRFASEIVPGVTSISAASAAAATPLVRHEDVLTVLPGTLPVPELARRLADTQAAVIMKLGRTFPGVVEALGQAGRLAEARYVERASTGAELVRPVAEVDPAAVPYFSMIIVPGRDRRADSAGARRADLRQAPGCSA